VNTRKFIYINRVENTKSIARGPNTVLLGLETEDLYTRPLQTDLAQEIIFILLDQNKKVDILGKLREIFRCVSTPRKKRTQNLRSIYDSIIWACFKNK